MDSGLYPGSGFQTAGDGSTGAIRGRLEFGNRQGNLRFVGTLRERIDGVHEAQGADVRHGGRDARVRPEQLALDSVIEIAETDQILTVAVDCLPMYDSNNGILIEVGKTTVDGICQ